MAEALTNIEADALNYVAGVRLAEAEGIRALAGRGLLSDAAQRYLEGVEGLFKAIRERDAAERAAVIREALARHE